MSWKDFMLRLGGLVLIALGAGPIFALTVNLLVWASSVPEDAVNGFGNVLTEKAIFIWCGCLIAAFASIFARENWRYIFYFSPLYAPALFAVIYTLAQ